MQMLQKCNTKYYVLSLLFVLISGCASDPVTTKVDDLAIKQTAEPLVSDKTAPPVANALPPSVGTPAAAVPAGTAAASEDLSTKTVAPVGFDKFMGIFTPYRITIQQGNFVSQEMAAQVKEGMTREQVRFLLGTALLTDMFHADRWDYIFRLLKPNGELTTSRVTIYFKKSLVAKIERGELPNEQEYLTRITNAAIVDAIEHIDRKPAKAKSKDE